MPGEKLLPQRRMCPTLFPSVLGCDVVISGEELCGEAVWFGFLNYLICLILEATRQHVGSFAVASLEPSLL